MVVDGEDTTVVAAFRDFAVTFKKKYSDDAAERKALDTFRQNQLVMAEHQRLNPLATFGVTQFSDMTQEEFATLLGTAQPPQPRLTPRRYNPRPSSEVMRLAFQGWRDPRARPGDVRVVCCPLDRWQLGGCVLCEERRSDRALSSRA